MLILLLFLFKPINSVLFYAGTKNKYFNSEIYENGGAFNWGKKNVLHLVSYYDDDEKILDKIVSRTGIFGDSGNNFYFSIFNILNKKLVIVNKYISSAQFYLGRQELYLFTL